MTIRRWLDLEDIETFFFKQIVKWVTFIKKVIHIQKVNRAHMVNILGCHSFRWVFYIFFAQCLKIWFHSKHFSLEGLSFKSRSRNKSEIYEKFTIRKITLIVKRNFL